KTRELNALLAARSSELSRIIDERAEPLAQRLAESGSDLQRSLEEATEKATQRLRQQNAALVNALATRTAETLTAVDAASNSLSEKVNLLIDRLSTSNERLGDLVQTAAGNLVDIDEKIVNSTERFASNAEKAAQTFASSARLIDANAGRLTELSTNTLKDIAGIA